MGGIGTASLLADVGHEVPTAVLPQANDQYAQAYSVEHAGVGLWMKHEEWSVASCTRALDALLPPDCSYRKAAARVQESFAPLDGTTESANRISDFFFGPNAKKLPVKSWT